MEKVSSLNTSEIETLKKEFELLTFPNDFDLVYEDQVPNAGIALIEGKIELIKDSKVLATINEGSLLGVNQMLKEEPLKYGCRVKAKSKIILLGKSDVLNLRPKKKSSTHPIIKAIKTG